MPPRKKVSRRKKKKSTAKKSTFIGFLYFWLRWPLLIGLLALFLWVLILDVQLRDKFDGRKWALPARVYAQPLELYQGLHLSPEELIAELQALGYRPVKRLSGPGQFSRDALLFRIHSRGFTFFDGQEPARRLQLQLRSGYVDELTLADGEPLSLVRLEPAEIGGIYPALKEDRLLVRLEDIPPLLGESLMAIEDRSFLDHYGLSPSAIARAALANIKAGAVVQGGSTITQQLVKNFYLTHEQRFTRKVKEALMSLLLELHYSKREILETYINEVYLGQSGPRAIHGFGLAAEHYFNQTVSELNSAQVALLVGLVKGASYYNPWRQPERARLRRNLVLQVMFDRGLITQSDLVKSQASSLGVVGAKKITRRNYPAFLDLVKRQLLEDYQEQDLSSEGLRIFTSFSLRAQQRAEQAVERRLNKLEGAYQLPQQSLQTAVVTVAVGSGEVLALVGDRQRGYPGFNRALDARRSVGSLIKPALYLTALQQGKTLVSSIDDSPVKVQGPNSSLWQPQNFDHKSHGKVPLFKALSHSYNQAAVRLGMQLGLDEVATNVERLGVDMPVARIPAMLLGAVEWSPLTVASLYHTIAADGFYTPLRSIRSVQTVQGLPLSRYPLVVEQRFDIRYMYQLKVAMELVMRNGSGRSAYKQLPAKLAVAGKTGTSNDQRDSWFAGFSGDTLAVVWMGRDDNDVTPLTGASGALQLWSDIMVADPGRGLDSFLPVGLSNVWVDSNSGLVSAKNCRGAILLPFIEGTEPRQKGACEWIENPLIHWWKQL